MEGFDRRAWRTQRDLTLESRRAAWQQIRAGIDPFARERARRQREQELNPGIPPRHATALFDEGDVAVQIHPEQGTDGTYGRRFPGQGVYNESTTLPDTI